MTLSKADFVPNISLRHKHCLLVVDDEPEVCNSIKHLLRRGFQVLTASSAADAVVILANHEVEIILTDQRMPVVTGGEMLVKVKTRYPDAIRVLFTGYADLESIVAAVNDGHIYRFLSKPWLPEQLMAALEDAAAEYHRIFSRIEEMRLCQERVLALEAENETLRKQIDLLQAAVPNSSGMLLG